ncbi:hypothetical protein SDC9_99930 [bioreactor metagenome]|uniref:Uncharacterized protein n=1 Tax=bioreactor metagenome TaxID=1076179 RepID=A0A645AIW4_9ZZZZ
MAVVRNLNLDGVCLPSKVIEVVITELQIGSTFAIGKIELVLLGGENSGSTRDGHRNRDSTFGIASPKFNFELVVVGGNHCNS